MTVISPHKLPFRELPRLTFIVLCDNKRSLGIALSDSRERTNRGIGKAVVLVKSDGADSKDNERGIKLAERIAAFLNTLTEEEVDALVPSKMRPASRRFR